MFCGNNCTILYPTDKIVEAAADTTKTTKKD